MLKQDRIRTMTRLAIYEEEQIARDERVNGYFGNDYVFSQMVGSFISGTIAFGIVFAVYCGYHFDTMFLRLFDNSILDVLKQWVRYYAVFIIGFCAITFVIYRGRFRRAQSRLKKYRRDLEFMAEEYELYDKPQDNGTTEETV